MQRIRVSLFRISTIALLVSCAACSATITYRRVTRAEDGTATGIRYYASAPYLLIYSDGKGGLKWQILYLPDQSQLMSASPVVHGGKVQMSLFFQNGVLGTSSVSADSTSIPTAVMAAAEAAAPLILAAFEKGPQPNFPAPYLYKIVVKDRTATFIGGPGDSSIKVPIPGGTTG